jgi:hypothetical protein
MHQIDRQAVCRPSSYEPFSSTSKRANIGMELANFLVAPKRCDAWF